MAKVYGQDIPSKYFDTYHNFFARSYDQNHQPYGKSVKRSNWDFPGYPYHPKFPSPAQLYVRAVFKSATICWHLQPDVGGAVKPAYGPRPKEWWETEADKDRTFGYRKFMRDTLLQKFRVGDPDWCEEIPHEATYVDYRFPHTNFCESKSLLCSVFWWNQWQFTFIKKNPLDIGKQFLYMHVSDGWYYPDHHSYVDACIPFWFDFRPCELTYDDLDQGSWPFFWVHMSRDFILDGAHWHRFWIADYDLIAFMVYYPDFHFYPWGEDSGVIFDGPLCDEVEKRPYFAHD
ncbi:MAG: hypothetical protein KAX15_00015 [Candidatus Omnitrophica bacterium]|nr:hypothetical protein [Candidatus Omnitrophota bacterium]